MILDIGFETMPREDLEAIQLRRLKATIDRVYANIPFYKEKFKAANLTPNDIKSLEDLQRIPFTSKQDLRDNYPFGLFAVPMDNVVRIHASSGTTGKPTVVGYTARDVGTWAELMARALVAGGAHRGDVIHNAYGYGLFTGGLGIHYGAEKLGASVISGVRREYQTPDYHHERFRPHHIDGHPIVHPSFGRGGRRDGNLL